MPERIWAGGHVRDVVLDEAARRGLLEMTPPTRLLRGPALPGTITLRPLRPSPPPRTAKRSRALGRAAKPNRRRSAKPDRRRSAGCRRAERRRRLRRRKFG